MDIVLTEILFRITRAVISLLLLSYTATANLELINNQRDETPFYKCWQYPLDSALVFPPVTDNGTVFLPGTGGHLKALDSGTGSIKWSVELGGAIASNLILENSDIYLITSPAGSSGTASSVSYLRVINPQSGITRRNIEIPYGVVFDITVAGSSLVVVNRSRMIAVFDMGSGEPIWHLDLTSEVKVRPGISGEFIALASKDDVVRVIDVKQGTIVFETRSSAPVTSIAMLKDARLVIGDKRGNLISYLVSTSVNDWKFKLGGAVASISPAGEDILLTSLDNFLYLIDPNDGGVRWRKRLSGRATFTPLWIKDRVYTPTLGESSVVVTEMSKGKSVNKIELGETMYPLQIPSITGSGLLVFAIPGSIAAFGPKSCIQ